MGGQIPARGAALALDTDQAKECLAHMRSQDSGLVFATLPATKDRKVKFTQFPRGAGLQIIAACDASGVPENARTVYCLLFFLSGLNPGGCFAIDVQELCDLCARGSRWVRDRLRALVRADLIVFDGKRDHIFVPEIARQNCSAPDVVKMVHTTLGTMGRSAAADAARTFFGLDRVFDTREQRPGSSEKRPERMAQEAMEEDPRRVKLRDWAENGPEAYPLSDVYAERGDLFGEIADHLPGIAGWSAPRIREAAANHDADLAVALLIDAQRRASIKPADRARALGLAETWLRSRFTFDELLLRVFARARDGNPKFFNEYACFTLDDSNGVARHTDTLVWRFFDVGEAPAGEER